MYRCLVSVAVLAVGLLCCGERVDAGSRFAYRGRTVVRGHGPMLYSTPAMYGQPVLSGPSSYYAYPTAAEYMMSPLYNPVQHPLMPYYGGWHMAPMPVSPYGDYYAPIGYDPGW